MSATFTGTGGADPIAQFRLAKFASDPTREELLFGGQLMIATIRERTFAGTDVDGAPFAPYSERYAARKAKSVGGGLVNLFGTGHHTHMLNELQTIIAADGKGFNVGIYTNDELEQRARVHNEGLTVRTRLGTGKGKPKKGGVSSFAMPRRRWLDASISEVEDVYRAIGERIDERLKRLN